MRCAELLSAQPNVVVLQRPRFNFVVFATGCEDGPAEAALEQALARFSITATTRSHPGSPFSRWYKVILRPDVPDDLLHELAGVVGRAAAGPGRP